MADQKLLNLNIARVDGPVFDGEAISVQVPGISGDMTILANHTALISPLKAGVITVTTEAGRETYEIQSGTLEISHNLATILI